VKDLSIQCTDRGTDKSIQYYKTKHLIRTDSVVSLSGTDLYITHSILGADTLLRVSLKVAENAQSFVFKRIHERYNLVFIETLIAADSIKVNFVESDILSTSNIDRSFLKGLLLQAKTLKSIKDHIVIAYSYMEDNQLFYTIYESHPYIKGLGKSGEHTIPSPYGNIYLDLPLLEDRTILPLHHQLWEQMYL